MTADDFKLQLLAEKWDPIKAGFKPPPGWLGPFLADPETVAELQRRNNLPEDPHWQIIF